MVRLTTVLARVPVIRFRAGGGGGPAPSSPPAAAAAPAPASAAAPAPAAPAAPAGCPFTAAPAASMSTSAIPDLNLPIRYQRTPLSEEEIEHINGGGIESSEEKKTSAARGLPIIKVPKGVLKNRKEILSLNIILSKPGKRK